MKFLSSIILLTVFLFANSRLIAQDFLVTIENQDEIQCQALGGHEYLLECDYQGGKALLATTMLGRKLFVINSNGQAVETKPVREIRTSQGEIRFAAGATDEEPSDSNSVLDDMFLTAMDYDSIAAMYGSAGVQHPLVNNVLDLLRRELAAAIDSISQERLSLNFADRPSVDCTRIPKADNSSPNVCSFMSCSNNQILYSPNQNYAFHPALFSLNSPHPLRPLSYGEVQITGTNTILYRDPNNTVENQNLNSQEFQGQQNLRFDQQGSPRQYFDQQYSQPNFRPLHYSLNDFLPSQLTSGNSPLSGHPSDLSRLHHFERAIDECEPSEQLNLFKRQVREFRDQMASANVTQYVYDMVGILGSTYLASHALPPGGCYHGGVYYDISAFERSRDFFSPDRPRTTTLEESQNLFKAAQGMSDIAWGYRQDGCYARAHLMARRFEEMGFHVDKIWIKGDLKVGFEDGENIEWNFHVAPVVHVPNQDGSTTPYVIDPSIMDEPVPMDEWMQRMTGEQRHRPRVSTFPFPENASVYGRASYVITNSDPYLPDDYDTMSESEKMNEAVNVMASYKELE